MTPLGDGDRYLDSVINLSYVLLRMLEKYSKSKAYMYVRKKKSRASKKKKNSEFFPLIVTIGSADSAEILSPRCYRGARA